MTDGLYTHQYRAIGSTCAIALQLRSAVSAGPRMQHVVIACKPYSPGSGCHEEVADKVLRKRVRCVHPYFLVVSRVRVCMKKNLSHRQQSGQQLRQKTCAFGI